MSPVCELCDNRRAIHGETICSECLGKQSKGSEHLTSLSLHKANSSPQLEGVSQERLSEEAVKDPRLPESILSHLASRKPKSQSSGDSSLASLVTITSELLESQKRLERYTKQAADSALGILMMLLLSLLGAFIFWFLVVVIP